MALPYKEKNLALIKKIFERQVFYKTFESLIKTNKIPDRNEIKAIINSTNLSLGEETKKRRSSTARSWLDWILRIADNSDRGE